MRGTFMMMTGPSELVNLCSVGVQIEGFAFRRDDVPQTVCLSTARMTRVKQGGCDGLVIDGAHHGV